MYDNVNLWFAKNINNKIITIDEVDLKTNDKYYCPMCGSDLIPKAINSKLITSHFAHVDASKCNGESMIHFWFKNKFLEPRDIFVVNSDKERQYICKEVLIEQSYDLEDKIYRPDVTVLTECGNIIYFEMDYSNKKKIQDYIDIWLELKNIVVEVDIKKLMSRDKIPVFKALFYNGKCFNTKKNDTYYNTIGKYKEEILGKINKIDDDLKLRIQKLDWFWNDVLKYKKNEVDIEYMVDLIDSVDSKERNVVFAILNKPKCIELYKKYIEYKTNIIYKILSDNIKLKYKDEYLKYIKSSIQYDNYDKCYRGYIEVFDLSDNCWILCDVTDNDTNYIVTRVDSWIKGNENVLKQKEIEKIWKLKTDLILQEINSNLEMIEYIKILEDKQYKLGIWFNYLNKEKYLLNIAFYYNKYTCAERYELEILDDYNVDNILNHIKTNIENYFNNLNRFKLLDDMNNIVASLNEKYWFISELNIDGKLCLEDIYEIKINCTSGLFVNKSIYLSNSGIMKDLRSNEIIYPLSNIYNLKQYIINIINNLLVSGSERKCVDCGEEFSLSFGEIDFYSKKGFKYPRRCKLCRDKRKLNKKYLLEG